MKLMKMFTSFFDRAIGVLGILGVFILAFLLVFTNYEVVGRYLLNRPAAWSLEIIEYGMLYLTFLGTAWLLREDEHIKMDVVNQQLRPSVRVWINTITSAIAAISCLIITWYGIKACWGFYEKGQYFAAYLEPPKWIIVGIVPVGTFLLFIQFLRRTCGYLKSRRVSFEEREKVLGELQV